MPSTPDVITTVPPTTRRRPLRWLIGAAGLAVAILAATHLPLDRWLLDLVQWIREAGAMGVAVFALVYVLATVFMLPGSLLTLGAGFAWGPLGGTLVVSPVSVAAATAAFLLGRTVARGAITRRVEGSPRFSAIDQAIGSNGFRIVALLRLSPVFPFNLLNYALGLTRVRIRDYVLASLVGMLPGTFMYVYLGSLVTSAAELLGDGATQDRGPWQRVLFFGGLLATVIVTVLITRIARRALDQSLGTHDRSST